MRHCNLTLSSSSSDSDKLNIESCFDVKDKYKETNTNIKLTSDNTNINNVKGSVNTGIYNINRCDKANLA